MDWEFTLYTNASKPPREVIELFFAYYDVGVEIEEMEKKFTKLYSTQAVGVYIAVATLDKYDRFETEFGFAPKILVSVETLDEFKENRISLLKAVLHLIDNLDGALLIFYSDFVILSEFENKLFLDSSSGFWTPDAIELLNKPYEMKNLNPP